VPTKKQRRRQQKNRRHEYEYVYVDEEGQEVDVDPAELGATKEPRERPRAATAARGTQTRGRAGRTIEPPSWRRVGKRALFLAPVFVIVMMLLNRNQSAGTWIAPTLFLILFFVPFSYFTDSLAYRMYKKRVERGEAPGPKPKPKTKPKTR
jgi:hypothetical protein